MDGLPVKYKLKMGECMLRYGMSYQDGVDLYGKYVGNWGGCVTSWRFDAKKDGEVVASVTKQPSRKLKLEVRVSNTELHEGDIYDMAAVRVRLLDGNGETARYAQLPVKFELEGNAKLVGPDTVTAEGGMCGTYIKTNGRTGKARLIVSTDQTGSIIIDFIIK